MNFLLKLKIEMRELLFVKVNVEWNEKQPSMYVNCLLSRVKVFPFRRVWSVCWLAYKTRKQIFPCCFFRNIFFFILFCTHTFSFLFLRRIHSQSLGHTSWSEVFLYRKRYIQSGLVIKQDNWMWLANKHKIENQRKIYWKQFNDRKSVYLTKY